MLRTQILNLHLPIKFSIHRYQKTCHFRQLLFFREVSVDSFSALHNCYPICYFRHMEITLETLLPNFLMRFRLICYFWLPGSLVYNCHASDAMLKDRKRSCCCRIMPLSIAHLDAECDDFGVFLPPPCISCCTYIEDRNCRDQLVTMLLLSDIFNELLYWFIAFQLFSFP